MGLLTRADIYKPINIDDVMDTFDSKADKATMETELNNRIL